MNNVDLKFREATKKDVALISALADKIWREHYPAIITMQQIDYMLANRYSQSAIVDGMQRGEKYFLAIMDNEPAGYGSVEAKDGFYFMHKWLEGFTYRITIGPGIFCLSIILSLAIAWLAVGYKAVMAALTNPVKSLRSE